MFELVRAKRASKCKNCGDLITTGEMCLEWRTHSFYGGRLCQVCTRMAYFTLVGANDSGRKYPSDYKEFLRRRGEMLTHV